MSNWGLEKNVIEPYYKIISDKLSLSGEKNDAEVNNYTFCTQPKNFVNSPSIKEHSLVRKLIKKLQRKNTEDNFQIFKSYVFVDTNANSATSCINCQSCFSGCPRDSFFRPSKIINEWIIKKYFSYHDEYVERIKLKNNQYEILTKTQKKLSFDKIFLCAGALNSAKIIIKSFGYPSNKIYLYDIPTKYFPIISLIPELMTKKNTFGFSTGNGSIVLNSDSYYHILFGQLPKEFFYAKFGNKYFSKILKNISDVFCMYGTLYGSNKDFLRYNLTKDFKLFFSDNDRLISINNNLNSAIKALRKKFLKKGFLILDNFLIDGKSSSHYSSNLFKAYNIKTNNLGEFNKNLHICDSSILGTASSSQPHTFFLMSNSYRLASNSLSEL